MSKSLQQKIKEAESKVEYLKKVSLKRSKGIRVRGFKDIGVEVVVELIERQKRIIQSLRDGKIE